MADERPLITSRKCDRRWTLRNGTAANEWRIGRLPGRRTGRAIYVSRAHAELLFGPTHNKGIA